jgi:murein DD-endopeptidase MepM/ murein hydrolase activator NlpD
LKAIIQSMYMNGTQSYLEVLMGAASFSDFLDRLQDLVLIGGQQKDLLVANKADRQRIGQVELQEKRELGEQKVLLAQEQGAKEQLAAKEQQEKDEDARLGLQIQDLEEQNAQEEQQMLQFASQEAKLISESMKGTLSYRGGKLAWPFAKDYPITSPFGKRTDPINGSSSFHPGIDIGAPKGTDILAAEDGIVVVAQWYGGYGNCVILDHGHGVMTLYGHMLDNSITVKKGETVKRGQKIGEVGMTGRSTGYHLHFGVYVQSKAVPPLNYLK